MKSIQFSFQSSCLILIDSVHLYFPPQLSTTFVKSIISHFWFIFLNDFCKVDHHSSPQLLNFHDVIHHLSPGSCQCDFYKVTCQSSSFFKFSLNFYEVDQHLFPVSSSTTTFIKSFCFFPQNFLLDFYKVVSICFFLRSSLPRGLISERAFPIFNENQLIQTW